MAAAPRVIGRCSISKFIPSAAGSAAALLFLAPRTAAAHGFGQRFDLPLPLWLWVAGAGGTIVLTFALVALFARERFGGAGPRVDLLAWAPLRALAHPRTLASIRALAALVFVLAVAAGLAGSQDPYRNLLTTLVWVGWWVGFAFVCALLGDLWALVNPLRTLFVWAETLYAAATGGRALSRRLAYPAALDAWPAVALLFAFAWAELVWPDKDAPARLALAVLAYAGLAWAGMFLYGRETWLAKGEAFGMLFGLLARFAPLEHARDPSGAPRLMLRLPGAGLLGAEPASRARLAFVMLMLASVTFDGFLETPLMQRIHTAALGAPALGSLLFALSEAGLDESRVIDTAALLAFPLGFLVAYLLASRAMAALAQRAAGAVPRLDTWEAGCAFVLTLVPIAVAYHLSHYFSLLLTAGQFLVPLASDPFGSGWNLFGTAGYRVDLGIVSPYVFWYGAVTLIVTGHVIAVILAHLTATRVFGPEAALPSQIPMMALMVAYTTLSLWILAQPIVG